MTNQGINITLSFTPELNVQKINVLLKELKNSLGSLGKNIHLIDEAKLKTELSQLDVGLNKAANSVNKINVEGSKLSTTLQKAADKSSLIGKMFTFNQMAMGMQMLTSAMSQFTQPFVELDKQVQNIGTLGRANFKEFSNLATELSQKVPDSAEKIAQGVYQAISAGMKGTNKELMQFVETASKAATAGLSDTETAVNGLTSVINAYGKSASNAGYFSDAFFAAIKLGKTTFNELNSSLASFVPTAASMDVSFTDTATAIAKVTAMGTPTAQAGTQINAALLSILKGNTAMVKGLKASGLTLQDLKDKLALPVSEGGGLINVLRDIKVASDKSGVALIKMTGRAEGMKIIESLVGSQDKYNASLQTYADIQSEIAGGASSQAFEVAAQSIEVKTKTMINNIQSMFHSAFSLLGADSVQIFDIFTKMSPALMGFSALAPVFGSMGKGVTQLATKLITMLIPSLTASTVGTVGFGAAFKALTATMMANPIFLVVGALGALVGAYALLHKSEEDNINDRIKEDEGIIKNLQLKKALNLKQQELARSNLQLSKEYEILGNKTHRSYEEQNRFVELHNRLSKSYKGVLGPINDFAHNQKALAKAMGTTNMESDKATVENAKLISRYEELGNKTKKSTTETKEFKTIQKKLNTIFPGVISSTTDWASQLELLKEKAGQSSGELNNFLRRAQEIQKELDKTNKTQQKDLLKRAQLHELESIDKSGISSFFSTMTMKEKNDLRLLTASIGAHNNMLHETVEGNIKLFSSFQKLGSEQKLSIEDQKKYDKILSQIQNRYPGLIKSKEEYEKIKPERKGKSTIEEVLGFNLMNLKKQFVTELKQDNIDTILYNDIFKNLTSKLSDEDLKSIQKGAKEYGQILESMYNSAIGKVEIKSTKIAEDNNINESTTTTEQKRTAYQIAQQQYSISKQQITVDNESKNIMNESLRIASKRKKTVLDDINVSKDKLTALNKEKDELSKLFKIQTDNQGKIKIGINLSEKEIQAGAIDKIKDTYAKLNNEINEQNNNLNKLKWDADLNETALNKKLYDLQKSNLQLKINLGLADPQEMISLLQTRLEQIKDKVASAQDDLKKYNLFPDNEKDQEILNQKEIDLQNLKNTELSTIQEINDAKEKAAENERTRIAEQNAEHKNEVDRQKSYALELTDALAQMTSDALNNQKAYGKALLLSLIDIVEKELLVAQIKALGEGLAASTIDPTAIARTIGIIAAIKTLSAGLKHAIGAEEGGEITEGYNKPRGRTDTIPIWVAPEERIFSRMTNKKYHELFDFIQSGGDPAEFYIDDKKQIPLLQKIDIHVKPLEEKTFKPLSKAITKLINVIDKIKPYFNADKSSIDKIIKLVDITDEKKTITKDFYANKINVIEYENQIKNIKSFASGTDFIYEPQTAIIGDNPIGEAVLTKPDVVSVAQIAATASSQEIIKELQAIRNSINNLDGRMYVLEQDVADGVNRYNNRQNRRVR